MSLKNETWLESGFTFDSIPIHMDAAVAQREQVHLKPPWGWLIESASAIRARAHHRGIVLSSRRFRFRLKEPPRHEVRFKRASVIDTREMMWATWRQRRVVGV